MKKFLLTLFVGLFGFIGFSNALIFPEIEQDIDWVYIPRYGYYINDYNKTSVSCKGNGSIGGEVSYSNIRNESFTFNCPGTLSSINGNPISNISFLYKSSGNPVVFVKVSSTPNSELSPVVSGLWSVFGEFIPYIVYISIGILLVTLGFYCIKWLMVWMGNKIKKYF